MKKLVLYRAWNQTNVVKEIPIDRLNELPDPILIHILSFLTIKEAAVTCVLSKRWRFLWSEVPRLELWELENQNEDPRKIHRFVALGKTRRFIAWVNRILAVRKTTTIDKFSLRMQYGYRYRSDIDNWINYAVDHKVKTLILLIHSRRIGDIYSLPSKLCSSSSLEYLLIQGQITMKSFKKINWGCLTELYLENVALSQYIVNGILAGCPVLRRFEIKRCCVYNDLDIRSRNLHTLVVEYSDDEEPYLGISAPYLHFLDVSFNPGETFVGIDVMRKARIEFILHGYDPDDEDIMIQTEEILENIQHVEELQLKHKCFEVISMMAMSDWQLPESTRCRLEVSSSITYKYNVSGIMALLESSPNLETLVLEGFNTDGNYAFQDPSTEGDLDCNFLCLKSIYFRNFADSNGEPMLTLVRILVKRAPFLENMEVVVDGVESSVDFNRIYQELRSLPRAIAVSSERNQFQSRTRYKAAILFR